MSRSSRRRLSRGTSLAATTTLALACASAGADTLWAYDGFDYAPSHAPDALNGLDGGLGWAGDWRQNSGATAIVAGLSYTDTNGRALVTTGNAFAAYQFAGYASRYTQQDFGDAGTSVWVSLLQTNVPVIADGGGASVALAGGGGEVGFTSYAGIGRDASGSLRSVVGVPNSSELVSGRGSIAPSQTVLHVVRYDFAPDGENDTISLWRNPLLGAPLGAPTISASLQDIPPLLTGATLAWTTWSDSSRFVFDELRIGSSFAAVTPFTSPVPEPGTTALFAAGLSVVGFLARRRTMAGTAASGRRPRHRNP